MYKNIGKLQRMWAGNRRDKDKKEGTIEQKKCERKRFKKGDGRNEVKQVTMLRSSRVVERLGVPAKVATDLGSIPAASDTVESDGRQMKQC